MSSTEVISEFDPVAKGINNEVADKRANGLRGWLEELDVALAASVAEPADSLLRTRYEQSRRGLAVDISTWPKRDRSGGIWADIQARLGRMGASGAQDYPLSPEDQGVLAGFNLKDWPGLVAMMVLAPAWRCSQPPLFAQVPESWWSSYSVWLFTPPKGFNAPGDAELYAQHIYRHLKDLDMWVQNNLGSVPVRAAVKAYINLGTSVQLYFSAGHLRAHAELRGNIIRRYLVDRSASFDLFALPREGRRLRVGFINRHFGSQTETYTTLPCFELLDPARFEVLLFTLRDEGSPLEQYCRAKASSFEVMPNDLPGQLAALRAASLDVVVYGTNMTAVFNEIANLALYRVAPLQVVNNSSCITSGLSTVDLYVSGDLTELPDSTGHFTERLGLLPGPAHAFNYEADRKDPSQVWSKSALGVPEDAFLFVSAANYFKVIPEMREAWARMLAAVPGSRLLLHPFNRNWSRSYPVTRFCAEFEAVLARHGVDHNRLIVSTMDLPSRSDLCSLIGVGDLYLDTAPFGGVNSLVDPLEAGVPLIAWQGDTMRARMGAALLKSIGLPDLIVENQTHYVELAIRIAETPSLKTEISGRIKAAMNNNPIFLDALAASEQFGNLIETAYDELVEVGGKAFRRNRKPLRALRQAPLTRDERRCHGNELLAKGSTARAVTYLLAALEQDDGTAGLWLDAARALRANGNHNDAITALENAIRIDETLYAGWVMLAELADQAGNIELADQCRKIMWDLQPNEPKPVATAPLGSDLFF